MKATLYYRIAFALPVLLGVVSVPVLIVAYGNSILTAVVSEIFSSGFFEKFLGLALLFFFLIPVALAFAPVAIGALVFLRNRDEDAHRKLARRAPWLFGFSAACISIVLVLTRENVSGDLGDFALIPAVLAVIVGYVYLGLAAVVFSILRACSLIDRA